MKYEKLIVCKTFETFETFEKYEHIRLGDITKAMANEINNPNNQNKRSITDAMCDSDSDDGSNYENANEMMIRFKWIGDGCSSMDEIIARLQAEAAMYTRLKYEGWVVRSPVSDDYGYLVKQPTFQDQNESPLKRHQFG